MNFNLAIPFTKLFLLLRRNVLIPKEDHAPLRNQQPKLVFLLRREVLELEADNLGADVRRQVDDLVGSGEQRLLLWVGPGSRVDELTVVVADLVDVIEVERPGRAVWVAVGEVDAGLFQPLARRFREVEGVLARRDEVLDVRADCDWGGGHVRLMWWSNEVFGEMPQPGVGIVLSSRCWALHGLLSHSGSLCMSWGAEDVFVSCS